MLRKYQKLDFEADLNGQIGRHRNFLFLVYISPECREPVNEYPFHAPVAVHSTEYLDHYPARFSCRRKILFNN